MGYIVVGIIITVALFFCVIALLVGAYAVAKVIELFMKGDE